VEILDLAALLTSLIALLAIANARFLRLPSTIGVTIGGLLVSVLLLALSAVHTPLASGAVQAVQQVDFDEVVFLGVLSFLLFAGALGVDSLELWRLRWPVLIFALVATALSIGLVGGMIYGLLALFDRPVSFVYCLLFGALISPTDPVAVLGMLKHAKVPRRIETLVAGESLFNDGIGVVAFTVIASIATAGHDAGVASEGANVAEVTVGSVATFFAREALGGLALGVALGLGGLVAMRLVDDYVTEVLISLGLVLSLTAIAFKIGVSAPLAAVAAGLLVGSLTDGRPEVLSSQEQFEGFWNLLDELLNVALFALLALEILAVDFQVESAVIGLITIPLVLLARTLSVNAPMLVLERVHGFSPYTRRLMIWGGLRGALGVAMAFTLPSGAPRDLFLVITYAVVVFSIVVQGLTVGRIASRAAAAVAADPGGGRSVDQANTK
jgi:CPA1 family monovalent cation:H+ antiporter